MKTRKNKANIKSTTTNTHGKKSGCNDFGKSVMEKNRMQTAKRNKKNEKETEEVQQQKFMFSLTLVIRNLAPFSKIFGYYYMQAPSSLWWCVAVRSTLCVSVYTIHLYMAHNFAFRLVCLPSLSEWKTGEKN